MGSFTKLQRKIEQIQMDLKTMQINLKDLWLNIDKLREVFKYSEKQRAKEKLDKIEEIIKNG